MSVIQNIKKQVKEFFLPSYVVELAKTKDFVQKVTRIKITDKLNKKFKEFTQKVDQT